MYPWFAGHLGTVVRQVAAGRTTAEIRASYPELETVDIQQALHYAAQLTDDELPADDELDFLVDSVRSARTDPATSGGLSREEHRKRNAQRLATLPA